VRRVLLLAALVALIAAVPAFAAGHVTVTCKQMGKTSYCDAKVPLKGGASNKTVTVNLSGTGWKFASATVSSKSLKGAYSLSGGHFTNGGKTYVAKLNAVQSIRRGYLRLIFGH
jgi:hypothetical protein